MGRWELFNQCKDCNYTICNDGEEIFKFTGVKYALSIRNGKIILFNNYNPVVQVDCSEEITPDNFEQVIERLKNLLVFL